MKRAFQFILQYKKTVALGLCIVVAAVFFLTRSKPHPQSTNPNVIQPVFAVEYLEKFDPRSVYFTLTAERYLLAKKPGWVTPHGSTEDLQDLFHAGQDVNLWRRLDHTFHFDAVLLSGDPSEFQPLLEGLLVSKDWSLVYLDQTSIIFRRGPATGWTMDDFHALQQKFANYAPVDRATYLTMLASKLLAIGWYEIAKQQLDQSVAIDGGSPATWTQMALYDIHHDPNLALEDTDRALKMEKDYYYALTARIRVLMAMRRDEEALHVSDELVKTHKDDPLVLYSHAMIAHAANAYTEEIATLKRVIEIVSAQKQSVAGFRVFLAQAYEYEGQAPDALDQFQKALDEKTLSDEEAQLIVVQMNKIKSQTSPQ